MTPVKRHPTRLVEITCRDRVDEPKTYEARIQTHGFLCSRCGQTVGAQGNDIHTVTKPKGGKP